MLAGMMTDNRLEGGGGKKSLVSVIAVSWAVVSCRVPVHRAVESSISDARRSVYSWPGGLGGVGEKNVEGCGERGDTR